jgi:hypothetical protein
MQELVQMTVDHHQVTYYLQSSRIHVEDIVMHRAHFFIPMKHGYVPLVSLNK